MLTTLSFDLILDDKKGRFEVGIDGITFSMNQKGGMYLIYQGFPYTKKSSSFNRHYWRCIHQKPLSCKAGIAHILDKNRFEVLQSEGNSEFDISILLSRFKVMHGDHSHPIITERRKPGEFKALMARQQSTTKQDIIEIFNKTVKK